MNLISSGIEPLLNLIELVLLLLALVITTRDSVAQMVTPYRVQSLLLALITGTATLLGSGAGIEEPGAGSLEAAAFVAFLPFLMMVLIRPLLIRATVAPPLRRLFRPMTPQAVAQAEREWTKHEVSTSGKDYVWFLCLVIIAFIVGFVIATEIVPAGSQGADNVSFRIALTVALVLYLVGLYNMIGKGDTISQVIGLLVMDHGLYLAVVRLVQQPRPSWWFIVGLYVYTLITLMILIVLLPKFSAVSKTIDLAEIADNSSLKG